MFCLEDEMNTLKAMLIFMIYNFWATIIVVIKLYQIEYYDTWSFEKWLCIPLGRRNFDQQSQKMLLSLVREGTEKCN